jgi:chemotaxis protein methyltransferase CheR
MNTAVEARERHREEVEIDLLLEGLFQMYEADFRGYERQPLRMRLLAFMNSRHMPTVASLLAAALHDPLLADALCRALIARDHEFFKETEQFAKLRTVLGSTLGTYPAPKIWVAECACAEEVFAFAIMLAEEKLLDRALIFATCSSASLLQEIRQGRFPAARLAEYEQAYRLAGGQSSLDRYVALDGEHAVFTDELRSRIIWAQYNLCTDSSFNEFQLISCQHRLFDFGPPLRKRILGLFHHSLAPYGILNAPVPKDPSAFTMAMHYKALGHDQLYRRVL